MTAEQRSHGCGRKPRGARSCQKLELTRRTDAPLESSDEVRPCHTLNLDFWGPHNESLTLLF